MTEQSLIDKVYESVKKESESAEKPKEKPKYTNYFPLGEGQGIRMVVWSNNIQFERRIKEGDEWKVTETIHLPRQVLEKIYIRLPMLFYLMKEGEK